MSHRRKPSGLRPIRVLIVLLAGLLALTVGGVPGAASAVRAATPGNQTAPTVTGSPAYNQLLTAHVGSWVPTPDGYSFAWLRNGAAIPDATHMQYRLRAADVNSRIAVQVTARDTTGASSAVVSAPTPVVRRADLVKTWRPTISGTRRWDHTLSASAGAWSPGPTSVSYQWLRDGTPVAGATGPRYRLVPADFRRQISVRVTARRANYRPATATSGRTARIGHRVPLRKTFTYSIQTRGSITTSATTFARLAAQTYAAPRGWRSAGYGFTRVQHGGQFTLVLAQASWLPRFSSDCSSQWSCRVGRYVVINQERWKHASPAWNRAHLSLRDYRHMVVDHETGHWLGHHHLTCTGNGRLAPVMAQQSKGLGGCRFNPWPLPSERWARR